MTGPASAADAAGGVRAGFDAAAAGYDTHGVTFFSAIAARLIQHAGIRAGDRVLDVGCGAGAALIPASRAAGPTGQVTGVDLSAPMLERAAAICTALRLSNVTLARADATEPPAADGSVDVVTASMMIFLLPDPARVLRAWLRVLRPGGTLAFSWNIAEDPRWVPVIAAVDVYVPGAGGFDAVLHHPPFTSIDAVQALMEDVGCTGVATMAETIGTRYTGPRQWWAASWSQAPRIAWQHMPPGRRETARTAAFGLLEPLRDQNDGSLTRRPVIGYTIARKAVSPATPKALAR